MWCYLVLLAQKLSLCTRDKSILPIDTISTKHHCIVSKHCTEYVEELWSNNRYSHCQSYLEQFLVVLTVWNYRGRQSTLYNLKKCIKYNESITIWSTLLTQQNYSWLTMYCKISAFKGYTNHLARVLSFFYQLQCHKPAPHTGTLQLYNISSSPSRWHSSLNRIYNRPCECKLYFC